MVTWSLNLSGREDLKIEQQWPEEEFLMILWDTPKGALILGLVVDLGTPEHEYSFKVKSWPWKQ